MSGRTVVSMPQGPDHQRPFVADFVGDPPYSEAVRAIVAALDDDGMHLTPMTVGGLRITAIRLGPVTRYRVPGPRLALGRGGGTSW